ncbi:MAG TPA: GAP family protein [Galbitalea sp.]
MVDVLALIGQLLPIGLAVAVSSVPLMVTITILLSPTAGRSSLAFLVGWIVGMFAVAALFSFGLRSVKPNEHPAAQPLVGVVEMLIGLAIVVHGMRQLVRRERASAATQLPRILRLVGSIRPAAAFGLALVLNVRPKAVLLAAAVGVIVGTAELQAWQDAIAIVVYVVLGASTVAVPIILCLARPERAQRPLRATQSWIERNNRSVTLVVEIVIGTVVLGDGLGRL